MRKLFFFVFCFLVFLDGNAQKHDIAKYQKVLDSLQVKGNFPGLSAAIMFSDNTSIAITSGFNDKEKQIPLKTTDKLMQGSVGKTYVAAIAMQLIKEGKLNLDEKVCTYLKSYDWCNRLPNGPEITVRMLMNHTSGVMRYEFKKEFTETLTKEIDKTWKPEELISYVLDEKAGFEPGKDWGYSDTNFILLGMIIEKITGKKYYDLLKKQILNPLKLTNTLPTDHRKLKGLAQGYAGEQNEFGGKNKVIDEDGKMIINPQFEWTGGGIYSTTEDLARWGKFLYAGAFLDSSTLKLMFEGVPAKLGRESRYGLGVIMRSTPYGPSQGHSGFFPGYLTEMYYFPKLKICVAVQTNTSDTKSLKGNVLRCLFEMARLAQEEIITP